MDELSRFWRLLNKRSDIAGEGVVGTGDILVIRGEQVFVVHYGTPTDGNVLTVDTSDPSGWTIAAPTGGGGGGGVTTHNALTAGSLIWGASGHTGANLSVASFSAAGVALVITSTTDDTVLVRRAGAIVWARVSSAELRDSAATSVVGRSANSSGVVADIAAGSDDTVLGRRAGALTFAKVSSAELRDAVAVSVLGRSANSSGVVGDIAAAANDTLLGRRSNVLTFAKVDLTTEVTGVLPRGNGGSGGLYYVDPRFGDGRDGTVVLAGNFTPTRDMNWLNLDLNGFIVTNDGWKLAIRAILTMNGGTFKSVADNGGTNGAGNSAVSGNLGAGGNGGSGASGAANGNAGTNLSNVWSQQDTATGEPLVGNGTTGRGGSGGGNTTPRTGGAAGTVAKPSVGIGWTPSLLYLGVALGSTTYTRLVGGGGGGGGASDVGFAGGGGGGAGVLVVCARYIVSGTGAGTLSANGGNGGNGGGTNSGGGGGGGGGKVYLLYELVVSGSLPTMTANGGTGGSKTGTGVVGTNGNAGTTEAISCLAA